MKRPFEKFEEAVKDWLEILYRGTCTFRLQDIIKNNQVAGRGLFIEENGRRTSVIIDMEAYYEEYVDRSALPVVISDIYKQLQSGRLWSGFFEQMKDFEAVKNMVTFSLVNAEKNRKILEKVPYIEVLDLAMIFHLDMAEMEKSHMKIMISMESMNQWGIRLEELAELAAENTLRLHPAKIRTKDEMLKHVLGEYAESRLGKEFVDEMGSVPTASPLYVLGSDSGLDGAATMLYDGVLKEFADSVESDLIILPTTVHEVMALPYDDKVDITGFRNMLRRMNQKETPPEDVLSDNIYHYRRQKNCLVIEGEEPGREYFLGWTGSRRNTD